MKTLFLILLIIFLAVLFWYSLLKKPLSYEKPASEPAPAETWNPALYPDAKG